MGLQENDILPQQLLFDNCSSCRYVPGSLEEQERFEQLQKEFSNQYELFFPDNLAPKTIVVIPSLTLDKEVLAKVNGALY